MSPRGFRRGGGGPARKPKKIQLDLKRDDPIDYKDVELLSKVVSAQGQMAGRRRTGLSAKRQRELKNAVKRARHLGLLSFIG